MLCITPENNEQILSECGSKNAVILFCREDNVDKGYVAFEQIGYILQIVGFEIFGAEEKLRGAHYITADAILRSLASYAVNHSCFYIECSKKELFPLLMNFSFEEKDDKITTNLSQILKVCKN